MNARVIAKSLLVLFVIGTLVSAQQASAESVFTPKGFDSLKACAASPLMPAESPAFAPGHDAMGSSAFAADTVETFDVQIEEEKGPGIGRQLAVFAIITAIVGYAVIDLMQSDDETSKTSGSSGKPTPPFSRVGFSARIIR
jgi:hypothetical protein